MRLVNWWRALIPAARRWLAVARTWLLHQRAYALTGGVSAPWLRGRPARVFAPSGLLLPLRDLNRDVVLFWTSRYWWRLVWWLYVAGPVYRAACWLGALDVNEGDFYRNGRWRWDIWRAGRRGGA
jgi:hypothetical protein